MFLGLGQLEAPSLTAATAVRPTVSGIKGLDAIDLALTSAVAITGPLASSPSENTPMRRSLEASMRQTANKAEKFAAQLTDLGWSAEPQAFLAIKSDAENLVAALSSKPSWGVLDTGVRAIQSRFDSGKSAVFARAASEAEAAKNHARGLIVGFAVSQPMSEDDWAGISKLADSVQSDIDRIAKLPLSPADAPSYLGAGRQLQGEIDSKLQAVSTGFMNTSEDLTRQIGMAPQRGRWIASWLTRNKWPVLGVIGTGVAIEWWRRRR